MRRKAPKREIITCNERMVRIKDGKYKGEVHIGGDKRMHVINCILRSKGLVNLQGNEKCLGCTKWIEELKKTL